ncbi:MAG: hypothetical protein K8F58_09860 [Bauldia sp.]|nr:hypothetical protein [Bauldia sp.]
MFHSHKRFAGAAALLLGLGATGVAMGAGQAESASGPLRCEIQATTSGGMIALEGVVHADATVSGSYRFRVQSAGYSGNSNIQQGGDFTAGPDGPVTLGQVMLGASGAVYDASLTVTSNGMTVDCAERVGGSL